MFAPKQVSLLSEKLSASTPTFVPPTLLLRVFSPTLLFAPTLSVVPTLLSSVNSLAVPISAAAKNKMFNPILTSHGIP